MTREYLSNGVHLMNGEFTLCGDAFDIAETEIDFTAGPFEKPNRGRSHALNAKRSYFFAAASEPLDNASPSGV